MTESSEPTVREHVLPMWAVELLLAKVAKANKRAARAGISERYTTTVEPFDEEHEDESGIKRTYHMARVNVIGDLLRVKGYTFAATVDWSLGLDKPLLRRSPELPEELRVVAPKMKRCEHCGTMRDRLDTYLVINEASGELTQVGRNCLAAYCGINPGWVSVAYDEPSVDDDVEEMGGRWSLGGHRTFADLSVHELLSVAHAVVASDGSYRPAKFENDSTKNGVWLVIGETVGSKSPEYARQRALREFFKSHRDEFDELATADIEWARALDTTDNDFLYNLKTLADSGVCTSRHVGIAIAILPARDRDIIKRQERAERGPVPVGKALTIEGAVERAFVHESEEWGTSWKMWVRLDNGSRVYSTVPQALYEMTGFDVEYDDDGVTRTFKRGCSLDKLDGARIKFVANVDAARDDVTTGFAKRPRKPSVLAWPTDKEEV